jgi:hypothetical protein
VDLIVTRGSTYVQGARTATNYGYGANQKTCYAEALRAGADIVVMVHPDYQYDPRLVPQIIEPIVTGYGLRILSVLFWFTLNQRGLRRSRRFASLRARYTRLP